MSASSASRTASRWTAWTCSGASRTCTAAPRPVRRFLPELIDLIWNRQIDPGKVFDLTLPLEQAAEGYRAMDQREAIKTLLRHDRAPGPAKSWPGSATPRSSRSRLGEPTAPFGPRCRSGSCASATSSTCAPGAAPAEPGSVARQRQRAGHLSAGGVETDVAFADAGRRGRRRRRRRVPRQVRPLPELRRAR